METQEQIDAQLRSVSAELIETVKVGSMHQEEYKILRELYDVLNREKPAENEWHTVAYNALRGLTNASEPHTDLFTLIYSLFRCTAGPPKKLECPPPPPVHTTTPPPPCPRLIVRACADGPAAALGYIERGPPG